MRRRRTVVVTGGSSGIGLAAAQVLARAGDEVVLLGRHPGRLARAVEAVRAAGGGRTPAAYRADFAVLDEVREAGRRIAAEHERIDVLANNAGQLAPAHRRSVDGHDLTVQSNHLAGFLLTHLLLDRLRAAAGDEPARIVTTSSLAEAWGRLDVARPGRVPAHRLPSRWLAYGSSKQANILFTVEAARRWAPWGIVATSYFPGLIQSRFGTTSPLFSVAKLVPVLFRTPQQGADTLVWLAHSPDALTPGGHYAFRRPFPATARSTDPARARTLWESSLTAVGLPQQ